MPLNPFELPGTWHKGNLHCHTTCSDGKYTPQELIDLYASLGYSFAAITDHRMATEVAGLDSRGMTLLRGIEIDGNYPDRDVGYHIVGVNVPKEIETRFDPQKLNKSIYPQEVISALAGVGAFVIVAHPYWCGQSTAEILELNGFHAIESINSLCEHEWSRGLGSVIWDGALERGKKILAVGVDDNHGKHQPYRGYTVVKVESPTQQLIMQALFDGAFYSSTGPTIEDFRREGDAIKARCSPARRITFMTNRAFGKTVLATEGKLLTEASYTIKNDRPFYVRLEIDGPNPGDKAWSNPIYL